MIRGQTRMKVEMVWDYDLASLCTSSSSVTSFVVMHRLDKCSIHQIEFHS